ncbi:MAG: hypothetical protein WA055_04995 [Candidatus Moraniibacteriota bacterium]
MRNFETQKRLQGMEAIFDLMKQGVPNAQLTGQIDATHKREADARVRGAESEQTAKARLKALGYVESVSIISGNDKADRRRKDLVVTFDEVSLNASLHDIWVPAELSVFAQIKSSHYGVESFYHELQRRQKCNREAAMYIVHNQRLVVLDASMGEGDFYKDFENQLRCINDFWRTKDIPISRRFRK